MTTISTTDYNIYLGDCWTTLEEYLQRGNYARTFIIVDENTEAHCLPILLKKVDIENPVIIETESGERNKNIATWRKTPTVNHINRKSIEIIVMIVRII